MQRYQLTNIPPQGFPPVIAVQGGAVVKGSRPPHYGFVGMWGILSLDPEVADTGIRHSMDAGLTWRRSQIQDSNIRYMSMPSSSTWYVTSGSWPRALKKGVSGITELSQKITMFSDNTTEQHSVRFSEEALSAPASRRLNQLDGYRARVLKTTDFGATWTTVYQDDDNGWYPNNLDCTDVNTCVIVGDGNRGQAIRTTDGGRTWQTVWVRQGGNNMAMDVRFVNPRDGFLAWGQLSQTVFTGYISSTNDGGATWTDSTID